tara:strand:- start:228 stop:575 length:348 start_codon:yes stop_codon:yes gene_type:complete
MNNNKNNTWHYFKVFNQYLLSFLLIFTGLHIDEHTHHFDQGYGFCNQGCDSSEHHSFHHDCEECINNSGEQKFFIKGQTNSIYDKSNLNYKEKSYFFIKDLNYHSFSSRAPPVIL